MWKSPFKGLELDRIPHIRQLNPLEEMLEDRLLAVSLWSTDLYMAEGIFWHVQLLPPPFACLVSGRARCTAGIEA